MKKDLVKSLLKYIKKGEALGNYRRHDLLAKILPLYFNITGEWYLGDKHALDWLKLNKPELMTYFAQAFNPKASITDIELLVEKICEL